VRTPIRDLRHGALHVWRIRIDQPGTVIHGLEGHLSSDETRKADALGREVDRRRFVVAHGALREILASYTGHAPRDLSFGSAFAGKPILIDEVGEQPLRFSLSHSEEWVLVGVTLSVEVGIDIERINPGTSVEAIAERFFSRREAEALCALPAEHRTAAFFAVWARKEAYVKARGEGIVNRLHRFSLSVDPTEIPVLLDDSMDEDAPLHWRIYDLDVADGYAAAVVAEGSEHRLRVADWDVRTP